MKTQLFNLAPLGFLILMSGSQAADLKPEAFLFKKNIAIEALDSRQKILDTEKSCVKVSQNEEQLKGCFVAAKETRKTVTNELRAKHNALKPKQ